jgi:hypothetical protein
MCCKQCTTRWEARPACQCHGCIASQQVTAVSARLPYDALLDLVTARLPCIQSCIMQLLMVCCPHWTGRCGSSTPQRPRWQSCGLRKRAMRSCSALTHWSAIRAPRSSETSICTGLTTRTHAHAMLPVMQLVCQGSSSQSVRPPNVCLSSVRICRALDLKDGRPVKKVAAQYRRPQRRSTGSSYSERLLQVQSTSMHHPRNCLKATIIVKHNHIHMPMAGSNHDQRSSVVKQRVVFSDYSARSSCRPWTLRSLAPVRQSSWLAMQSQDRRRRLHW